MKTLSNKLLKYIIIHIFHPEKRKFYNLERMWSELIPKERLTI